MATPSLIRAGGAYVEIYCSKAKFEQDLKEASSAFKSWGNTTAGAGNAVANAMIAVSAPIALAVKNFRDFDDQIRVTAGILNLAYAQTSTQVAKLSSALEKSAVAVRQETIAMEKLAEQARELGRTTSFTATQAASAMAALARAGLSAREISQTIAPMLDLARATGVDLARAADLAVAAMRSFNIEMAESRRVMDLLAQTANRSPQTIEDIGHALKYVGPAANALGVDIKTVLRDLGLLANFNLKGEQGGSSLRNIMMRLASVKNQAAVKGIFDVDVVDKSVGSLKSLDRIFKEIQVSVQRLNLDQVTVADAFKEIFGLRALPGSFSLMHADIDQITEALDEADGAAYKTAQTMDSGLGGAIRLFLSAAEALGNTFTKEVVGSLTKLINAGTWLINDFLTPAVKHFDTLIRAFSGLGASVTIFSLLGVACGQAAKAMAGLAHYARKFVAARAKKTAGSLAKSAEQVRLDAVQAARQATQALGTNVRESGDAASAAVKKFNSLQGAFVKVASGGGKMKKSLEEIKRVLGELALYLKDCGERVRISLSSFVRLGGSVNKSSPALRRLVVLINRLAVSTRRLGSYTFTFDASAFEKIASAIASMKKPLEETISRFDALSQAAEKAYKGVRAAFGQYTNRSANTFEKIMRRIHVTINDLLGAFEGFWKKLGLSQKEFDHFANDVAPPLREAFRAIKAEIDGMGKELRRITKNLTVSKQGFENYVQSIRRVAAALDLLNRAAMGIPLPYLGPKPLDVKELDVPKEKKAKRGSASGEKKKTGERKGSSKLTPEEVVDGSLGLGASLELLTKALKDFRKAMRAVHSEMNRFGRQMTKLASKASSLSLSLKSIVENLDGFKQLQSKYNTPFNELAETFGKLKRNISEAVPRLRRFKRVLDSIGGARKTAQTLFDLDELIAAVVNSLGALEGSMKKIDDAFARANASAGSYLATLKDIVKVHRELVGADKKVSALFNGAKKKEKENKEKSTTAIVLGAARQRMFDDRRQALTEANRSKVRAGEVLIDWTGRKVPTIESDLDQQRHFDADKASRQRVGMFEAEQRKIQDESKKLGREKSVIERQVKESQAANSPAEIQKAWAEVDKLTADRDKALGTVADFNEKRKAPGAGLASVLGEHEEFKKFYESQVKNGVSFNTDAEAFDAYLAEAEKDYQKKQTLVEDAQKKVDQLTRPTVPGTIPLYEGSASQREAQRAVDERSREIQEIEQRISGKEAEIASAEAEFKSKESDEVAKEIKRDQIRDALADDLRKLDEHEKEKQRLISEQKKARQSRKARSANIKSYQKQIREIDYTSPVPTMDATAHKRFREIQSEIAAETDPERKAKLEADRDAFLERRRNEAKARVETLATMIQNERYERSIDDDRFIDATKRLRDLQTPTTSGYTDDDLKMANEELGTAKKEAKDAERLLGRLESERKGLESDKNNAVNAQTESEKALQKGRESDLSVDEFGNKKGTIVDNDAAIAQAQNAAAEIETQRGRLADSAASMESAVRAEQTKKATNQGALSAYASRDSLNTTAQRRADMAARREANNAKKAQAHAENTAKINEAIRVRETALRETGKDFKAFRKAKRANAVYEEEFSSKAGRDFGADQYRGTYEAARRDRLEKLGAIREQVRIRNEARANKDFDEADRADREIKRLRVEERKIAATMKTAWQGLERFVDSTSTALDRADLGKYRDNLREIEKAGAALTASASKTKEVGGDDAFKKVKTSMTPAELARFTTLGNLGAELTAAGGNVPTQAGVDNLDSRVKDALAASNPDGSKRENAWKKATKTMSGFGGSIVRLGGAINKLSRAYTPFLRNLTAHEKALGKATRAQLRETVAKKVSTAATKAHALANLGLATITGAFLSVLQTIPFMAIFSGVMLLLEWLGGSFMAWWNNDYSKVFEKQNEKVDKKQEVADKTVAAYEEKKEASDRLKALAKQESLSDAEVREVRRLRETLQDGDEKKEVGFELVVKKDPFGLDHKTSLKMNEATVDAAMESGLSAAIGDLEATNKVIKEGIYANQKSLEKEDDKDARAEIAAQIASQTQALNENRKKQDELRDMAAKKVEIQIRREAVAESSESFGSLYAASKEKTETGRDKKIDFREAKAAYDGLFETTSNAILDWFKEIRVAYEKSKIAEAILEASQKIETASEQYGEMLGKTVKRIERDFDEETRGKIFEIQDKRDKKLTAARTLRDAKLAQAKTDSIDRDARKRVEEEKEERFRAALKEKADAKELKALRKRYFAESESDVFYTDEYGPEEAGWWSKFLHKIGSAGSPGYHPGFGTYTGSQETKKDDKDVFVQQYRFADSDYKRQSASIQGALESQTTDKFLGFDSAESIIAWRKNKLNEIVTSETHQETPETIAQIKEIDEQATAMLAALEANGEAQKYFLEEMKKVNEAEAEAYRKAAAEAREEYEKRRAEIQKEYETSLRDAATKALANLVGGKAGEAYAAKHLSDSDDQKNLAQTTALVAEAALHRDDTEAGKRFRELQKKYRDKEDELSAKIAEIEGRKVFTDEEQKIYDDASLSAQEKSLKIELTRKAEISDLIKAVNDGEEGLTALREQLDSFAEKGSPGEKVGEEAKATTGKIGEHKTLADELAKTADRNAVEANLHGPNSNAAKETIVDAVYTSRHIELLQHLSAARLEGDASRIAAIENSIEILKELERRSRENARGARASWQLGDDSVLKYRESIATASEAKALTIKLDSAAKIKELYAALSAAIAASDNASAARVEEMIAFEKRRAEEALKSLEENKNFAKFLETEFLRRGRVFEDYAKIRKPFDDLLSSVKAANAASEAKELAQATSDEEREKIRDKYDGYRAEAEESIMGRFNEAYAERVEDLALALTATTSSIQKDFLDVVGSVAKVKRDAKAAADELIELKLNDESMKDENIRKSYQREDGSFNYEKIAEAFKTFKIDSKNFFKDGVFDRKKLDEALEAIGAAMRQNVETEVRGQESAKVEASTRELQRNFAKEFMNKDDEEFAKKVERDQELETYRQQATLAGLFSLRVAQENGGKLDPKWTTGGKLDVSKLPSEIFAKVNQKVVEEFNKMLDETGRIDFAKVPQELQEEINDKLAEMRAGFRALDLAEEIKKTAEEFKFNRTRRKFFTRGSSDYMLNQVQSQLNQSKMADARAGQKTSAMTRALTEQERNLRRQVLNSQWKEADKLELKALIALAKAIRENADEETKNNAATEAESYAQEKRRIESDLIGLEQEAFEEADDMGKASRDPRNRDPYDRRDESGTKMETASQGTFDALETMRGLGLNGAQNLAKKQCAILESIERNTRSDDDYI